MDHFQKEMFDLFVFEINGFLAQLESILMQAETQDSNILDEVPEIFRIMHTIKSSAAMMDLPNISKLAHSTEDLFYYIRENNPPKIDKKKLTDIVFTCVDYMKMNLAQNERPEDPTMAIVKVERYLRELKISEAENDAPQAENPCSLHILFQPNCAMIGLRAFEIITKVRRIEKPILIEPADKDFGADALLQTNGLTLVFASEQNLPAILALIEASPFIKSVERTGVPVETQLPEKILPEIALPEGTVSEPTISPQVPSAPPLSPAHDANTAASAAAQSAAMPAPPFGRGNYTERRSTPRSDGNYLAIEITKLDRLVNLAGELIISSMGAKHAFETEEGREQRQMALDNLHQLVLETQDQALSLRMITVADMFHKLKRSVRDAAGKLNRQIEFTLSGEETALDRKVIDHVFSPLMHILRNSIDHGIESPAEREAAGKPPAGKVHLSAAIDGNQAVLSVTDDGRGIDRKAVLKKAIADQLVSQEQAQKLSNEEVFSFLFLSGFSTRGNVTELSGRGVGLDAASDSVRKINGRIVTSSKPGEGTKMEIHIPLTLAILEALLLQIGQETCAIAISVVREAFKPSLESVREANGEDVVLYRGTCYQILRLGDIFGHPHTGYSQGMMLLLDANGEQYALYVDNALDKQTVVVKPIPPLLQGIRDVFGCTVLGNGKVCLIIDAISLWKNAKRRGDEHEL